MSRSSYDHMHTPEDHVQAAYRYALSLTHHHYDAEDLVQQAWLKCQRRYGGVRTRALLYTTIRNLFYDQCRRKDLVVFEGIDSHEPIGEAPAHRTAPMAVEDLDLLLANLRVKEREALYLHAVEGWTAKEIASKTRQPRNTVLSLIHRAKQKLAGEFRHGDQTNIESTKKRRR